MINVSQTLHGISFDTKFHQDTLSYLFSFEFVDFKRQADVIFVTWADPDTHKPRW